jgi:Xaa-Pro aminopeptidase
MPTASKTVSPDTTARRRDRLRRKLIEHDMDGYLVLHPANRFYLSGFELHDPQCNESAGCLLITADGRDWLCTDPRYEEAGKRIWPEEDLFIYTNHRITRLTEFVSGHSLSSLGF